MEELDLLIEERKKKLAKPLSALLYALMAILVAFIVLLNISTLCRVKGRSMEYTLCDKQYVLLFNTENAKRQDIIVFKTPQTEYYLIKRVIGVPGDTLLFASGDNATVDLYRKEGDGFVIIEESGYIKERMLLPSSKSFGLGEDEWVQIYCFSKAGNDFDDQDAAECAFTVPKKCYYVMGDNRNNSDDSRRYGFINKKYVEGKMLLLIKQDSFLEKLFRFLYSDKQSE